MWLYQIKIYYFSIFNKLTTTIQVMIEVNCLYLKNLPRRPRNNDHFTRLLISYINPQNKYVTNPSLPIANNETFSNAPLQLLDDTLGIVQISRSVQLQGQCFVTFKDQESAQSFKSKFNAGWRVQGRLVEVHDAHKNSLMGLAVSDHTLLQHVLKKRRIAHSEAVTGAHRLKRKMRRLRCKLRGKGVSAQEIDRIVETVRTQRVTVTEPKRKQITPVTVRENPPNKVLLVQNLPHDTTQTAITELFQSTELVEVRLVAVRKLAFVEYQSIDAAAAVRNKLGPAYNWNDHQINIEFAK